MTQISFVVFYNGKWDASHNYVDHKMKGMLVSADISYSSLIQKLAVDLQLDDDHDSINLMYNLDQKSSNKSIIELRNDEDVKWFLNLVKDVKDCSCPLIVSMSSTSGNDDVSNAVVDDVSNDVVDDVSDDIVDKDNVVEHVVMYAEDLVALKNTIDSTKKTMKSSTPIDSAKRAMKRARGDKVAQPMIIENVDVANLPQGFDIVEKSMFGDKFELKKALHVVAMKNNFEFKTRKSNNSSLVVACVEEGCTWYVRASRFKGTKLWKVRKYVSKHTCDLNVVQSDHRQATSAIISQFVKEKLKSSGGEETDPGDIVDYMLVKHGISISYNKAWRALDLARAVLRGSVGDLPTNVEQAKEKKPELKRSVGRPKKPKTPLTDESKKSTRCGRCNELGHNRKTCKNPIPTDQNHRRSKKAKINPLLET